MSGALGAGGERMILDVGVVALVEVGCFSAVTVPVVLAGQRSTIAAVHALADPIVSQLSFEVSPQGHVLKNGQARISSLGGAAVFDDLGQNASFFLGPSRILLLLAIVSA